MPHCVEYVTVITAYVICTHTRRRRCQAVQDRPRRIVNERPVVRRTIIRKSDFSFSREKVFDHLLEVAPSSVAGRSIDPAKTQSEVLRRGTLSHQSRGQLFTICLGHTIDIGGHDWPEIAAITVRSSRKNGNRARVNNAAYPSFARRLKYVRRADTIDARAKLGIRRTHIGQYRREVDDNVRPMQLQDRKSTRL